MDVHWCGLGGPPGTVSATRTIINKPTSNTVVQRGSRRADAGSRYNTPQGQGAKTRFSDGSTTVFTRLERPHLAFATNEMRGDPIYLINSAQYGNGTNPGADSHNDDACYTLIQPVNQK